MIGSLLALALAMAAQADGPLFDPVQGYRVTHYRGVVPAPPEGVTRVDTTQVAALWRSRRALLIDVGPAEGGVRDAATNRWKLSVPHAAIPGAYWFPEAGRGVLADGIGAWFLQGVAHARRARLHVPIIVYCLADCWMSWNAALRLHRAGYRDVRWYADGVDGWREAGLPTVNATPAR